MTTVFSPSLSEKLAEKGLESGSDWFYCYSCKHRHAVPETENRQKVIDALNNGAGYFIFSLQDIFQPENAKKLWGDEPADTRFQGARWRIESLKLLDLYLTNGLKAVEEELEKE